MRASTSRHLLESPCAIAASKSPSNWERTGALGPRARSSAPVSVSTRWRRGTGGPSSELDTVDDRRIAETWGILCGGGGALTEVVSR